MNWVNPLDVGKDLWESAKVLIDKINGIFEWFGELPTNIAKIIIWSFDELYNLLTIVLLQTPTILFKSSAALFAHSNFFKLAILGSIVMLILEGYKRLFKKESTKLFKSIKRIFLGLSLAGFLPFLFEKGFSALNYVAQKIGSTKTELLSFSLGDPSSISFLDAVLLLSFDIYCLSFLIPIFLQNGRRWWNLFILFLISPIACLCWAFDKTEHLFYKWVKNVKKNSTIQLYYSVQLFFIALFILMTRGVSGGLDVLLVKLLGMTAGVYYLAHPPEFVRNLLSHGDDDIATVYNRVKTRSKRSIETLKSLKNPVVTTKKIFTDFPEKFSTHKKNMRVKHGRRYYYKK